MAHDVFISYSSTDKTTADTVCSILEQNGIRCWIAPRDITPGLDFAEAIIDGIKSSKLFILVYSSNSSNSKQVIREVDRAVHTGLPIINLRLEDVLLSKQLEYYLSSVHWLDAMNPPLEEHIHKLSGVVKILLRKDDARDDDLEKAIRDGTLRGRPDKRSLAVLPFKNDSPDEENTYFINGLMEEILNNLQKIKDLRVISRTSVEQYRNQTKPIPEIAKELGVNYIVEGSGQKYGNSFRLRTQLIMAEHESHLWGESFQQKITDVEDIFNIQIKIAESIAEELKAFISPEEKKLIEKIPATDLEVYNKYLKARSYWDDFSRESLNKALEFLNSAVEKDPGWAPLYSGLAQVWMGIQQMGFEPPSVAMPEIYNNLNKALELDPDLSAVHYLKAMIAHLVEWDWQKSEKEFLEALAINPNDSLSRVSYAQLLCILQRTNEGITQGRLALDLDPFNPYVKCLYGAILPCVGDCKTAIDLAEEVTVADPGNYLANNVILMAAYPCKEYDKVIKAERYNLPVFNVKEDEINEIERIFNEQGFIKTYEKIMIQLEKFAENNPISPLDMAIRYIMANQPDKAMDCIEKGFEIHDPGMTYIATKIFNLDPLFKNPRFIAICEKMNLPLPKPD
jgi:TolB-like protein